SGRFYYLDGSELTPILKKECPGEEPAYYDADGNGADEATLSGAALFTEGMEAEQREMCDGTSSFIRWFVAVKGQPAFKYDTDLDVLVFTPPGHPSSALFPYTTLFRSSGRFYYLDGSELTPILKKQCAGEEPTYYDADGN